MSEGRYEDAIVRVIKWEGGMPTAGVGLLVGRRQVVTCAHVVNCALGRPLSSSERPDADVRITVEFPFVAGKPMRQGRNRCVVATSVGWPWA